MTEVEFGDILAEALKEGLPDYEVSTKESLIYRVIVDEDGKYFPRNAEKPVRGQLAFETDLLVKKDNLPLVVCELKHKKGGGFTTHDILTYSIKAKRHKEIYPYLRYGFIAGNTRKLSNKFFTHNDGFDFALAMEDINKESKAEFISLIREQVGYGEELLSLLQNKHTARLYKTSLEIEHV